MASEGRTRDERGRNKDRTGMACRAPTGAGGCPSLPGSQSEAGKMETGTRRPYPLLDCPKDRPHPGAGRRLAGGIIRGLASLEIPLDNSSIFS